MKSIYIIKEVQNTNSARKGERIEAGSLSAAKRAASRAQMFRGSVMKIGYPDLAVDPDKEKENKVLALCELCSYTVVTG